MGNSRSTNQDCTFYYHQKTFALEKLAKMYIKEIVSLHGVPFPIVSDWDPCFIAKFWQGLHKAIRTKMDFSMAYHP